MDKYRKNSGIDVKIYQVFLFLPLFSTFKAIFFVRTYILSKISIIVQVKEKETLVRLCNVFS